MRNMTIGQFYNVDSVIHRLDPRVKIMFSLVYVGSLFFSKNPVLYAVAFCVLLLYIRLSRVPAKFILRGLKTFWILVLMTGLMNLVTVKGATVLFEWHFIRITELGLSAAVYTTLRIIFIVIGSSMMTYTTTPNALTDGLERMLGWLKKANVPVHEFAMIMAIALRFVPVLVEEMDKIMKAQMARGMDFSEGNIIVRARKIVPVLIPLMVSAMKRSNELALAMDARCYHGGEGRTKMKPLHYERRDFMAYLFMFLYLVGMIVLAIIQ